MKQLLVVIMLVLSLCTKAQVKIGNNPNTIDANSLLELESTNKGFLPPRVALNSATSVSPLTGTVPSGMLVYSSGGTLADGYYYWNGTQWKLVATSELNVVTKTANATLTKSETCVLASNDITITFPTVTSSDNGLAITVKNIGTHTDLITVKGNGGATIDGKDSSTHTRWISKTYVAYNGNWVKKDHDQEADNVMEVSPVGSWTSIEEAVEFLDAHMTGPAVIKLSGGSFPITSTQVIDLSYPLTFQGVSYSKASIEADASLSGPMFRCLTECYFKMLAFDGTAGSYENTSGNDAIQLEGSGEYYEIKDCNFTGFNKTIVAETNVELWLFETDINDAVVAGVQIAAGATSGVSFKTSETDFINCAKGINLVSGANAIVSILSCGFYNTSGQTGLVYVPATFTTFASMFVTNNSWNNIGTFISGFDFTRTDGRDSKAFIQNNSGDGDRNPSCNINVLNSTTTTTLTTANTWYKAAWDYTKATVAATSWTVTNASGAGNTNRITFQPANHRSGYFIISGNLSVNNANRTISLGVVKNGSSGTRYGETTLRTGTANTSFQFSTIIYFADFSPTDYFEIYCSSANSSDIITLQDLQWFADTK